MLVGRGLISVEEYRAIQAHVQEDVDARRLVSVALDWEHVFASACALSETHTAKALTRSLDLLHVAAARALNCVVFVSADDRQLAVAKASGLKVVDTKRRARSPTRRH